MGSDASLSQPFALYREGFTDFQKKLNSALTQISDQRQLDVLVPIGFLRFRMLMEPLLEKEENDEFRDELEEIEEDEEFLKKAKKRCRFRTDNPEEIAERLRKWEKMNVLMRLAVREGLWGKEKSEPAEAEALSDEQLGFEEFENGEAEEEQVAEA